MQLNNASREIHSITSISPVAGGIQDTCNFSPAPVGDRALDSLLKFHPTPFPSTIPTGAQSKGPGTRQLAPSLREMENPARASSLTCNE